MESLGYEDVFNKDFDDDGIISGGSHYKLTNVSGQAISITDWDGTTTFNDDSSTYWDVTSARIVSGTGQYKVLLESTDSTYYVWTTNSTGVKIDTTSGWQTGSQMQAAGYEQLFNRDFNNDSSIG